MAASTCGYVRTAANRMLTPALCCWTLSALVTMPVAVRIAVYIQACPMRVGNPALQATALTPLIPTGSCPYTSLSPTPMACIHIPPHLAHGEGVIAGIITQASTQAVGVVGTQLQAYQKAE